MPSRFATCQMVSPGRASTSRPSSVKRDGIGHDGNLNRARHCRANTPSRSDRIRTPSRLLVLAQYRAQSELGPRTKPTLPTTAPLIQLRAAKLAGNRARSRRAVALDEPGHSSRRLADPRSGPGLRKAHHPPGSEHRASRSEAYLAQLLRRFALPSRGPPRAALSPARCRRAARRTPLTEHQAPSNCALTSGRPCRRGSACRCGRCRSRPGRTSSTERIGLGAAWPRPQIEASAIARHSSSSSASSQAHAPSA